MTNLSSKPLAKNHQDSFKVKLDTCTSHKEFYIEKLIVVLVVKIVGEGLCLTMPGLHLTRM